MSSHYDSDDAFPRSPPLRAFNPRATPSPSPPPPEVTYQTRIYSTTQRVSSPSSRRRKKSNRSKTRPSEGDVVLIRIMEPNRPDIAREVGEHALNYDSESGGDDDEMDERSPTSDFTQLAQSLPRLDRIPRRELTDLARDALNTAQPGVFKAPAIPVHRDSVLDQDGQEGYKHRTLSTDTTRSDASTAVTNGTQSSSSDPKSPTFTARTTSPPPVYERHSFSNGTPHRNSITSPSLPGLTIPPPRLPALQTPSSPPLDGTVASPGRKHSLPSFRHISEFAESAPHAQENRTQLPHRQSISSMGHSPTSMVRQLSVTSLSPGGQYPPLSAASPGGSSDLFLGQGRQQLPFLSTRRPSQMSDGAPFSATLHSATTNDSYQSSEGLSPGSQSHRPSIDSTFSSRTLPPPVGPNVPNMPPQVPAGFKCDYPGCTAPPFQTQYLLNSHANVHSQTRPHFCPVRDCPRSEGGKGFKRKNEMIRHGLVHASPGYVCPFCPDREHKYPRPDNLQRHVRVHHLDKNKDDPQLREVLAQRPEGGSRGRRRRS